MPGIASLIAGVWAYGMYWFAHDRGAIGTWPDKTVRGRYRWLLRRGEGPIYGSALVVEAWAVVLTFAGALHLVTRAPWAGTLEIATWVIGVATIAGTWSLIAIGSKLRSGR